MRRIHLFALLVFVIPSMLHAQGVQIEVLTDKRDALYQKGEKVNSSIDIPITIVTKDNVDKFRSLFK